MFGSDPTEPWARNKPSQPTNSWTGVCSECTCTDGLCVCRLCAADRWLININNPSSETLRNLTGRAAYVRLQAQRGGERPAERRRRGWECGGVTGRRMKGWVEEGVKRRDTASRKERCLTWAGSRVCLFPGKLCWVFSWLNKVCVGGGCVTLASHDSQVQQQCDPPCYKRGPCSSGFAHEMLL